MKNNIVFGIIAGLLLTAAGLFTYNAYTKVAKLRSDLKASNTLYSIVVKEKQRLDSLIVVYNDRIAERDSIILSERLKQEEQQAEIKRLREGLANALQEVAEVKADSSYKYIQYRVKPTSELIYPFDSTQVKVIHYTFIERDGLLGLNNSLDSLNFGLLNSIDLMSNQIIDLKSLVKAHEDKESIILTENEAYKIEVVGLNKDVKRQKAVKNITTSTSVGLAIALLIILI